MRWYEILRKANKGFRKQDEGSMSGGSRYILPYILGELVRRSCGRAASLWKAGSCREGGRAEVGGGGGRGVLDDDDDDTKGIISGVSETEKIRVWRPDAGIIGF